MRATEGEKGNLCKAVQHVLGTRTLIHLRLALDSLRESESPRLQDLVGVVFE